MLPLQLSAYSTVCLCKFPPLSHREKARAVGAVSKENVENGSLEEKFVRIFLWLLH